MRSAATMGLLSEYIRKRFPPESDRPQTGADVIFLFASLAQPLAFFAVKSFFNRKGRKEFRKGRKEDNVITKNVYPLNLDTHPETSIHIRVVYDKMSRVGYR